VSKLVFDFTVYFQKRDLETNQFSVVLSRNSIFYFQFIRMLLRSLTAYNLTKQSSLNHHWISCSLKRQRKTVWKKK